jgi:hypothetical protein
MIPISGIVNASEVSSASDPPLSSDSILIKWRPVTATGIGSWDNGGNHTIIASGGGVLVSWLVSLLSEEIMGFIVQGLPLYVLPHLPSPRCLLQIPYPQPIASTSFSTLLIAVLGIAFSPSPTLVSLSLPTRPSPLAPFASMFLEYLISVSISSTRDCPDSKRGTGKDSREVERKKIINAIPVVSPSLHFQSAASCASPTVAPSCCHDSRN